MLLQGGGALGAYHHGVYEALATDSLDVTWFAGTSIGAILAAILVGNPPEQRLEKLNAFWGRISWPQPFPAPPPEHPLRKPVNHASALASMVLGQPEFFAPRYLSAWSGLSDPYARASFYDTSPLARTLEDLIDFDRINNADIRLSIGAVEVETGHQVYFDNRDQTIDVRHVLASGALPPAFAPVRIGGCSYWDGGMLSNTPLDVVLNDEPRRNRLCFMIDLFDPNGPAPTDSADLYERYKDIIYASRSSTQIETHRQLYNLRRALSDVYGRLPAADRDDPDLKSLLKLGCTTTTCIVHLIYRGQPYRSWAKDFQFLPQTLADHRQAGYEDGRKALAERPWNDPVPPHEGIVVHEVDNRRNGPRVPHDGAC
ncbi:MAG: patatin-like phospholipase family protein [Aquisalimonadaceae bacterium]